MSNILVSVSKFQSHWMQRRRMNNTESWWKCGSVKLFILSQENEVSQQPSKTIGYYFIMWSRHTPYSPTILLLGIYRRWFPKWSLGQQLQPYLETYKKHISGPCQGPLNQKFWGWGTAICVLPKQFWRHLTLENVCTKQRSHMCL